MKDEGKEKTRRVAVLGVLRPDGFSYFSKYFAKMSRFIQSRWVHKAQYNTLDVA